MEYLSTTVVMVWSRRNFKIYIHIIRSTTLVVPISNKESFQFRFLSIAFLQEAWFVRPLVGLSSVCPLVRP